MRPRLVEMNRLQREQRIAAARVRIMTAIREHGRPAECSLLEFATAMALEAADWAALACAEEKL